MEQQHSFRLLQRQKIWLRDAAILKVLEKLPISQKTGTAHTKCKQTPARTIAWFSNVDQTSLGPVVARLQS